MIINTKESEQFSKISKDTNKIHINRKFSSNFFFKEPVVHGANLVLIALSKFLEKKRKCIFIKKITLNFKNFFLVN